MVFNECLTCAKLGVSCDGANFSSISVYELLEWCKEKKRLLGWSNAKLAEKSGMPIGTIAGLMAGTRKDVKHDTIAPLLKALVGGQWHGIPCANPGDKGLHETIAQQEKNIEQLNADNEKLKAELEKAIIEKDAIADKVRAESREHLEDLRKYNRNKVKAILVLAVLLFASLLVIIGGLIIDRSDPSRGFFWLDSDVQYFDSQRVEEYSSDADADEQVTIAYDGDLVRVVGE